jgi:hypothetical protein
MFLINSWSPFLIGKASVKIDLEHGSIMLIGRLTESGGVDVVLSVARYIPWSAFVAPLIARTVLSVVVSSTLIEPGRLP